MKRTTATAGWWALALLLVKTAAGQTVYWKGGVDSAWSNPANWAHAADGTAVKPGPGMNVVVDLRSNPKNMPVLDLAKGSETIGSLSISGGAGPATLTVANGDVSTKMLVVTGDVTIAANGVLTHAGNPGTSGIESNKLNLNIGGNLTIAGGGQINVDGKGFKNAGAGKSGITSGGSYGGTGGKWEELGPTFGSMTAPTNLGCGANRDDAGNGGGAVILSIAGAFTNNGTISANGNLSTGAGNGSGGSIYITCGSIAGSGTNQCNGNGNGNTGCGGGGGRMSVIVTNGDFSAFTGPMTAYGGLGISPHNGAAGTIYKQTSTQGTGNGDLVIDNNNIDSGEATDIPAGATWTVGNLIVKNKGFLGVASGSTLTPGAVSSPDAAPISGILMKGGTVSPVGGTLTVSNKLQFVVNTNTVLNGNLVLTNGATMTHSANAATERYKCILAINGGFTVAANATVNVDGKGYTANNGPGKASTGGAAGGAYGGRGGTQGGGGAGSGDTYGSITAPTNCGSGGYTGAGGGAVILSISGAATLNGTNSANGIGTIGASAGGSIYITCGSLSGSGALQCNGGTGTLWAGGGGGRLAVVVTNSGANFSGFTGSMNALGGGGQAGGDSFGGAGTAGTVYRKAANQTYGDLIVNQTASTGNPGATTLIGPLVTDTIVGDVRLMDQATLAIDAGRTLEVYGNWSNAAPGLTVSGAGTVEFKGGAASTVSGPTIFSNLKCVVPGKTLLFEGGSIQTVSGRLTLAGAEGKLLTLKSVTPGTRWNLDAVLGSTHDVRWVQVADSDAIALDPIVALDSEGASRNNDNWAFGPATNVWTGSECAAWNVKQNWSLGRLPTRVDTVVIADTDNDNDPVLDSDRVLGGLTVNKGAVLDMNNRTLCVRGDVRNAGKISGKGTLRLTGAAGQSVAAGGNVFDIVEVAGSGKVSFTDGFAAARFACRVPGADLVFNSGSLASVGMIELLGAPERPVKIRSSAPPAVAKWKLTGHAVAYYADVSDQDASAGSRICPVDSIGNGHTPNWDFAPKHCRGGVETEKFIGDLKYRIHTFTNSGTLTVNRPVEIEYLIVGGGGGGGNQFQGGGGGAGGFLEGKAQLTNGTLAVVVGAGGQAGLNGGNSVIPGVGVAIGGGCGGKESQPPSVGGSGGGGCHGPGIPGAAGTPGQGNVGGDGGNTRGGGGGGAGGVGTAADGGPGRVSAITGVDVTYAAGGAGRHRSEAGQGKAGGDNTGDGGGGCTWNDAAGAGGSGMVIVRYKLDIHNRPVSSVTPNGATFNAYLARATPLPVRVAVLWGEENGVASGAWARTNSWKAGVWGANSSPSTNLVLAANRSYCYTFEVTSGTNREVADLPVSFITGAVEVKVTRRESTEEKPAAFVITRPATATNGPLAVHYTLGGTGRNGEDYEPLESPAIFPAGATEVRLPVLPNFNMGETRPRGVELTLVPGGYLIGPNGKASMVTKSQ